MHSIARPRSQLKPGPSPRMKSALPKPTSIRAAMVVTIGVEATGLTTGAGAGAGVTFATGAGARAAAGAADTFFFAGAFTAAGFVAGAGDLADLDVVFFDALMVCWKEYGLPRIRFPT